MGGVFEDMLQKSNDIKVEEDKPMMLNGMYRKIIVSKNSPVKL